MKIHVKILQKVKTFKRNKVMFLPEYWSLLFNFNLCFESHVSIERKSFLCKAKFLAQFEKETFG